MSIGLYIVLAPLYLKSVRKLQEKRFVFVKILAIIIPENGAKVSKIKCFQFAQQTLSKGRLLEQITAETLHERCTDSVEITVSDVQQYAVFLEEQLSGEGYKVLSDGKIRIVNPKQDIEVYSRLAAEHGIFIRELTRKQASLEAYYMNLKKGGNQGC